jgi:hypothetical protein
VKLRIKGDSLRLRLTRGEVQQLAAAGSVEDQTHITSHGVLIYRLRRAARATELAATFENGAIDIQVPEGAAREWCDTELVTLQNVQRHGSVALRITVEKDYACLAPRTDEDESDNFSHPAQRSSKS